MSFGPIVVLTGAGISAESGIKTFRASDGLWENHRVEDVASPEGFQKNPDLVYRFYNDRRKALLSPEIAPNPAHLALSKLEREYQDQVSVITQNIDNLHERGGSRNVIHMHGELLKERCQICQGISETSRSFDRKSSCSLCKTRGYLRPHIVWFGEIPFFMHEIHQILENAGLFISVGTSGNVYPAAGFVRTAYEAGAYCLEVNPQPTYHGFFSRFLVGNAGTQLPGLVEEILNGTFVFAKRRGPN